MRVDIGKNDLPGNDPTPFVLEAIEGRNISIVEPMVIRDDAFQMHQIHFIDPNNARAYYSDRFVGYYVSLSLEEGAWQIDDVESAGTLINP